jgi:mono/diheme cytochrome c family protein
MLVRILAIVVFVFVFVAAAGCGGEDTETTEEPATTTEQTPDATATAGTAEVAGREQFVETCGGCHTLTDAGTTGQIGPKLDDVAPDVQQVLTAIKTGPGKMPENLLEGEEARQVAEYVDAATGG